MNGLSVYLTIPLLDTLFQESASKQTISETPIEHTTSILPNWIKGLEEDVVTSFNDFILSGDKSDVLIKICLLILIAFFLKNVFGYLQGYFMAVVEYGAMKDLRDDAFNHLHKLPISYFKKERTGSLISRFTNDVNIVQSSISATFSNLIKEPLTIIVFIGIALSISWELTLLAFIILPFSTTVIIWIGLKLRKQTTVIQKKLADITSVLQETISGVKIVKAFGMEPYENKRFSSETKSFFRLILRIVRIRNASSPITEFLSVIIGVFIIYYGGILVLEKATLSASEFLGFLFAIFQMLPPMKELGTVNNRIQEASAAGDRVFEILDTEPDIKNMPRAVELNEFKDDIKFQEVTFRFDDADEDVLKKILLTVW